MKTQKMFSIKRRVLLVLMGILVPAVTFLILSNLYTVQEAQRNQADTNRVALGLYCSQIEKSMEQAEKSLAGLVGSNGQLRELAYGNTIKTKAWGNLYELSQSLTWMMETDSNIAAMLIIAPNYQLYHGIYSDAISGYPYKNAIINYFREKVSAGNSLNDNCWEKVSIDGHPFLARGVGIQNTYCVALLGIENFAASWQFSGELAEESGEMTDLVVILDGQKPCVMQELAEEKGLVFEGQEDYYFTGNQKKYMVVEMPIAGSGLNVAYVSAHRGLSGLSNGQLVFLLGSLLVFISIPMGYWVIKKSFFKPVDRLVTAMEEIYEGEDGFFCFPDRTYPEIEFQKVNAVFLHMLERIRKLKIQAYEKELAVSRVTLQYYQIQIKPHFYLNCLKNIYGMAEEQCYDGIQKCVLYLSNHLRYMLKKDSGMVAVEEEMQFVSNYIQLQKLGSRHPLSCETEVHPDTMPLEIPTLSILSFVENSVKYCVNPNEEIKIFIKTGLLQSEEGSFLNLVIQDNGQGFSREQLDYFNYYPSSMPGREMEGHLGISNVIQRFLLVYGRERVGFAFSNHGGARIDIMVKCDSRETER